MMFTTDIAMREDPGFRKITMRWRGLNVRPFEGHTGSQKPHSMHLSTSSSAAGSGLRCLR